MQTTRMLWRSPRRRGRADKIWFRSGYTGMAGFLALGAINRQPGSAASLRAADEDRGTTRTIGVAYALATDLPVLLRRLPGPELPRTAGPVGLLVQAGGLALRAYSMRALGRSYTRTLRTEADQRVIVSGPYQWVRHPGYSGSLLIWVGYALTSRSVPAVVLVAGLLGEVYRRRIVAEEQMLRNNLPGYDAYCRETKKLIPFVW